MNERLSCRDHCLPHGLLPDTHVTLLLVLVDFLAADPKVPMKNFWIVFVRVTFVIFYKHLHVTNRLANELHSNFYSTNSYFGSFNDKKDLNTTELFGPVVDSFMPTEQAFLGKDPQVALQKGDFHKVRVITGVAENEGAGMLSI